MKHLLLLLLHGYWVGDLWRRVYDKAHSVWQTLRYCVAARLRKRLRLGQNLVMRHIVGLIVELLCFLLLRKRLALVVLLLLLLLLILLWWLSCRRRYQMRWGRVPRRHVNRCWGRIGVTIRWRRPPRRRRHRRYRSRGLLGSSLSSLLRLEFRLFALVFLDLLLKSLVLLLLLLRSSPFSLQPRLLLLKTAALLLELLAFLEHLLMLLLCDRSLLLMMTSLLHLLIDFCLSSLLKCLAGIDLILSLFSKVISNSPLLSNLRFGG
mmetsp:Transcript_18997/g.33770  ORF Transcript_18997/g.33770 Transcript_18997/m.33770 type:complete len:264 (-) Transcript_18997:1951-2742(-)